MIENTKTILHIRTVKQRHRKNIWNKNINLYFCQGAFVHGAFFLDPKYITLFTVTVTYLVQFRFKKSIDI